MVLLDLHGEFPGTTKQLFNDETYTLNDRGAVWTGTGPVACWTGTDHQTAGNDYVVCPTGTGHVACPIGTSHNAAGNVSGDVLTGNAHVVCRTGTSQRFRDDLWCKSGCTIRLYELSCEVRDEKRVDLVCILCLVCFSVCWNVLYV